MTRLYFNEVVTRDGFQIEPNFIPTKDKVRLIDELSQCGYAKIEVTSFTLMALFIARLGTAASASHQIAASLTALLYMVPLSFSIAISARVSFWIGARNAAKMREAIRIGFQYIAMEAFGLAGLLWLFSEDIARLYAKDTQVTLMAASLLVTIGF